jgi:DNA polymerase-3 subunit alpha
MVFNHLHCHTQFSLLDGAANIDAMLKKAADDGMKACAITDHGNMFGVFQFVNSANKLGVKPIIGCEFYLVKDRHKKHFTKPDKDIRYHQLLLAKNPIGYKNLSKLCSLGWIEGKYGSYPRIDKELIEKYHEGLIATTCCLGAEVPRTIMTKGEDEAELVFKWWLNLFGEDYFVELQRHGIPEQDKVNAVLFKFAKKYNVPIIASNDSHYTNQEDAPAHEILLAINTGSKMSDPTSKDFLEDEETGNKGKRFAFANDQFFFKNTAQMSKLFQDLPQAIDNTNLVVDKVEEINLKRDILLPNFPIPEKFRIHADDALNQWEYLKHITYEGAKKRYKEINSQIQERIDFELFTIKTMGFAGYFLIVSDFIQAGRDIGVFVGPGRGSAAGSVVAYCIGITNLDPIKYNLLFERFLNPDRKSMPDIDTDFDDEGRQKVIDYVVDKYGKHQVAQIVTYSTMAAKMSIKDVGRVLDLPLDETNALTKLVPEKPGISLNRLINAPLEGEKSLTEKEGLLAEDLEKVKQLREIIKQNNLKSRVLSEAMVLEGSVRGTGVHAAGIIIAPSDLTELMPMATAKDSNFLLTQFEGGVIEEAGVIKMDFLGLKTLTIIKNTLKLIKLNHNIDIDIDAVDLNDKATYETFQRGETNGIFQFESPGMQKYLKELKPDKFEDLIAMNALYRPGPLAYIPEYIERKHGRKPVEYDLADMEEYLADTYGITVYQEQVMLLSQKLADFTKGDADVLRKAMGKKDRKTLDKLKPMFIEKASAKGYPSEKLEKIWTDWEAFAAYAFNKSHSTCYAFVAFQTAWLKTHYPAEFMAANLTNEKDNIEKMTFFLEECKRMNLKVLGPDVNESLLDFGVNKQGEIRFGLGAIKGTGDVAAKEVIEERNKNGLYKDIFDFSSRLNTRTVNKKTYEAFALAGAFDGFSDLHRAVYFYKEPNEESTFLEKILRHGQAVQETKANNQNSLFGSVGIEIKVSPPKIPKCEPFSESEKLRLEKEVVGIFISGHPLDQYKIDIENFCTTTLNNVLQPEYKDKDVMVAGIVTKAIERTTKTGKPFGMLTLEDYTGKIELALFGEDYIKFKNYLIPGQYLTLRGKVKPKLNAIDMLDLKITQIDFLQDLRKKCLKSIKLYVNPTWINNIVLRQLVECFENNKGTIPVKVNLTYKNHLVEMSSLKYKVDSNNAFIEQIKGFEGIELRLCSN